MLINLALPLMLITALFVPPLILSGPVQRLSWFFRYTISVVPFIYTFVGWQLMPWARNYFQCEGSIKMIHDCIRWHIDFTAVVNHSFFLMLACIFIAAPISVCLLGITAYQHIKRDRKTPEK